MASVGLLARRVSAATPANARSMANLRQLELKLKSYKTLEKITKTMKMVASAAYSKAEKALNASRSLGSISQALFDKGGIEPVAGDKTALLVVSSDKGFCGGIHGGVARAVRLKLNTLEDGTECKLFIAGDKARTALARTHGEYFNVTVNVGSKPPNFSEAVLIAKEVIDSDFEFTSASILYNHFLTAAAYDLREIPVVTKAALTTDEAAEAVAAYEEVDDEALTCYTEFTMASTLFYAMLESSCAEQSARMQAMQNASDNAGDLISKTTIKYNRQRQAVITTELIEIISGAAALEG
jgi:F-type H+-transporting ATPase subunit gamma